MANLTASANIAHVPPISFSRIVTNYAEEQAKVQTILRENHQLFQFNPDDPWKKRNREILWSLTENPVGVYILQRIQQVANLQIVIQSVKTIDSAWCIQNQFFAQWGVIIINTFPIDQSLPLPIAHYITRREGEKPHVESANCYDAYDSQITATTLAHELIHIIHLIEQTSKQNLSPTYPFFDNLEEQETIIGSQEDPNLSENTYRKLAGLPLRVNHTSSSMLPAKYEKLSPFSLMTFYNYYETDAIKDLEEYCNFYDLEQLSSPELLDITNHLLEIFNKIDERLLHKVLHKLLKKFITENDFSMFEVYFIYIQKDLSIIEDLFLLAVSENKDIYVQHIIQTCMLSQAMLDQALVTCLKNNEPVITSFLRNCFHDLENAQALENNNPCFLPSTIPCQPMDIEEASP